MGMHGRRGVALAVTLALLVTACTAGDDSATEDTEADSTPSPPTPTATGPSPGVTDDTIKVGVTYVDTASLVASGLNYDLGDHQAVYTALFDAINADGGINGRQIEPVFAPIDPTNPAPAEEKCVQLTEDEDVFVITGFFLADAVNCPSPRTPPPSSAASMTPERLEQAQAPWVTWTPDTDQPDAVLRAMADQGELDGTVGVWAAAAGPGVWSTRSSPPRGARHRRRWRRLIDRPGRRPGRAVQSETSTIAQRFDAAGADTVVLVGSSGQAGRPRWPTTPPTARSCCSSTSLGGPRLLHERRHDRHLDPGGIRVGGGYGPDQARFEEPAMQECIQTLAEAGVDTRRRGRRATTRPTSPTRPPSRPAPTWPCSGPRSKPPART